MTLELGRIMTWRLPAFSALLMLLRASWRTEVRTILAVLKDGDSQIVKEGNEVSAKAVVLASKALKLGECPS